MSYERLIFSTITLAKNKNEADTIFNAIETLSKTAIPLIVVVDGGSLGDFIERVKNLPRVSIIKKDGKLFAQIKESLKMAWRSNYPYVFYAESNKEQFFKNSLDMFLGKAASYLENNPQCGMILPSRTPESFSTFPSFQQETESSLNRILRKLIGVQGDFAYGPRVISRDLIPYLDKIKGDVGWGWMSFLLILTKRLGKGIYTIDLNLPCPEDERKETDADKLHRLTQLKNHIEGINEALNVSI